MQINIIIFILSIFSCFLKNPFLIFPVVAIVVLLLYSLHKKNFMAFFFLILGILIGKNSFLESQKNTPSLSKGFINTDLQISGFPELRTDENYEIKSFYTILIGTNLNKLCRSQTVNVYGYINSYKSGTRSYSVIYVKSYSIKKKGFAVFNLINQLRNYIENRIKEIQEENIKTLLFTLILGNTNFIGYSTSQSFRMTGVAHLLSISGLHVSILSTSIIFILAFFVKKKTAFICSTFSIIVYITIAGFGAPIMRAGVMFIIYNSLKLAGIKISILDAALYSIFIILLFDPFQITQVGLYLSYSAVLGIHFLSEPIITKIPIIPVPISSIIGTTLAANIATLPILLYYFKGISILSPVTNILVIQIFNLITILCFFEMIFILIGIPLSKFLLEPIISIMWNVTNGITDNLSLLPISYSFFSDFPLKYFILLYSAIFFTFLALPKVLYRITFYNLKRRFRAP